MTLLTALIIAAVFESAGALIAGGDVVSTISKGIIDPASVADANVFMAAMMAALVSSALWINLATWIGAPVSTTHSIVGGVMGAGIAAAGFSAVNWATMGGIAASWVISPFLGGLVAAGFLAFIKTFIIYQDDKIAAARKWVPVLIGVMSGTFASYLALKGLKKIVHIDMPMSLLAWAVVGLAVWAIVRPLIRRQSEGLEITTSLSASCFPCRLSVRRLFCPSPTERTTLQMLWDHLPPSFTRRNSETSQPR